MKQKLELEYTINSSPKVLFNRLSTAGGLSEWFADNVNVKGETFTFIWSESEQIAELILKKDNKYVRFRWIDEEEEKFYFEFKVNIHELTGDVALLITDFAEEDELDDTIELWNTQIAKLKHVLGL
ncbi:hypothetical protein ES706_03417 [subsurface metagenome]